MRKRLAERGADVLLIAKVEKPQARRTPRRSSTPPTASWWRGGLGIELPIEEVPLVQKRLLAIAGRRAKATITAKQCSIDGPPTPDRAEVADVANAIFDGTDAVMLSQETAVGRHPVLAVEMMASIAETTERELPTAASSRSAGRRRTTSTTRSRSAPWARSTSSGSRA